MSLTTRLARAAASQSLGLAGWHRVSSVAAGGASRHFVSGSTPVAAAAATAGGPQLKALAEANPYKDVVRYQHKNRKWNLQHVDYYSEALAIGLLETGLQPGDVVLSWLPEHFSESVSGTHQRWTGLWRWNGELRSRELGASPCSDVICTHSDKDLC